MLEEKFQKLGKKLDDFLEKGEQLKGKAHVQYIKHAAKLKQKRGRIREKLDEMKDMGRESMEEMKEGVADAIDDLQKSYDKAKAVLKNEPIKETSLVEYSYHQHEEYVKATNERLNRASTRVEKLRARGDELDPESKKKLEQGLKRIAEKEVFVQQSLVDLAELEGKEWDDKRSLVDLAMEDLERSTRLAESYFNREAAEAPR